LEPRDEDIQRLLSCKVHLGTKNVQKAMEKYVFARRKDGINVIDLHTTWQKVILAARMIATVENPLDVCVISSRPYGQRAVLKFSQYTNSNYLAGRLTPGQFTNQIQEKFMQPRLLIVTDPRTDHQAILESSYVNIPVIALCDTDSPTEYVDCAIPCNNRGRQAIAILYWLLAREVLRIRGSIVRSVPWEHKVDLFLYRDPDEVLKKNEESADSGPAHTSADAFQADKTTFAKTIEGGAGGSWGDDTGTWDTTGQWSADN